MYIPTTEKGKMSKQTKFCLVIAAALLLLPASALATASSSRDVSQLNNASSSPVLDFGIVVPTTGTISYNGGKKGGAFNPLVGKHIDVDYVIGEFTPQHNFVKLSLVNAFVSFQTGNFFGSTLTSWEFGGGGFITLTADCIDLNHDGDSTCDLSGDLLTHGAPLMTGSWDGATVTETTPKKKTFKLTAGLIDDRIWQPLLGYYGLQNPPGLGSLEGDFNLAFIAGNNPPNSFNSSTVLSGDFADPNIPKSPEPASLLLFGTGLIGVAGLVRRKLRSR
jgi:hypothetical protein